ncbi:MAG: hypothetical protein AAGF94_15415 [Pseudomonadota bacterium]
MRFLLLLTLATPAAAWEFSVENDTCRLTHTEAEAEAVVTYTPADSLYAITLTGPETWAPFPFFVIRFDGARPLTITTDRQTYAGSALTVTDRGFGNVLDGLASNQSAIAQLGPQSMAFSLEGAAPEVAKFRACTDAALA